MHATPLFFFWAFSSDARAPYDRWPRDRPSTAFPTHSCTTLRYPSLFQPRSRVSSLAPGPWRGQKGQKDLAWTCQVKWSNLSRRYWAWMSGRLSYPVDSYLTLDTLIRWENQWWMSSVWRYQGRQPLCRKVYDILCLIITLCHTIPLI